MNIDKLERANILAKSLIPKVDSLLNMNKKVSEFVRKYVEEHLDKSDPKQQFGVFVVWQCYILGNAKWLLYTTLPDGMYYEVTYNKIKDEFYLDAYKKFENRRIPNK